jgi:hypothetical protein
MRIRSFIIAYALVLAILLFADRRPGSTQQDRYSHVVDLTDGRPDPRRLRIRNIAAGPGIENPHHCSRCAYSRDLGRRADSAERLVAPLVVMDLNAAPFDRRPARRFLSTISPRGNRTTA